LHTSSWQKLRRKTQGAPQLVDRTFDALLDAVIRNAVERLDQILGLVLLVLPRLSSRLPFFAYPNR
jgi:hypothetical protein